ncbi:MAG: hypothetical protein AB1665_01120 [Candidatus Thermoplasmatota archaeon]
MLLTILICAALLALLMHARGIEVEIPIGIYTERGAEDEDGSEEGGAGENLSPNAREERRVPSTRNPWGWAVLVSLFAVSLSAVLMLKRRYQARLRYYEAIARPKLRSPRTPSRSPGIVS